MSPTNSMESLSNLVLVEASNSFSKRVEGFLQELRIDEPIKQQFRRETVKLILGIQDKMGATILRALAREHDFFDEFQHFKNIYLDVSAYCARTLWRQVVYFIQNKQFKYTSDEVKVLNSDILYAINCLSDEDIEKIIKIKVNHEFNAALDLENFSTGKGKQRDMESYCKSKSQTLKFITKYDYGLSQEDFTHDIAVELIRVNNNYNRSSGKNLSSLDNMDTAIKKYIETSLNNKVSQAKDFWTSEGRRRVTSTHAPLYAERSKLKKLLEKDPSNKTLLDQLETVNKRLREDDHDYYSVVTPLVRTNESENREVDAQEIDPSVIQEDNVVDSLWMNDLVMDLPPRLSRCVRILAGEGDEEFRDWSKSRPNYNLDILDHLFKAAMEFTKVTRQELRNHPTILRALSTCSKAHAVMTSSREADLIVQNAITKKIHEASIQDQRDDGTFIFNIIGSNKTFDTGYDTDWKVVTAFN